MRPLSSLFLAATFIFLAPVVAGLSNGVTKDAPKAHAQNETVIFKTGGMALDSSIPKNS